MNDQQELHRQLDLHAQTNGKDSLLQIAESSFFRTRSIGAGPEVEIEVERATRVQALYLGKGAFWRTIRRMKLGHIAMTGEDYLAP